MECVIVYNYSIAATFNFSGLLAGMHENDTKAYMNVT